MFKHSHNWWIVFWVFPRRLSIKSRRFGTLCRSHHQQVLKMELTQCSETSAFYTQTPGKYLEDNSSLLQHGESLKSRMLTITDIINFPNIESPCRSLSPSQISNHPVGHYHLPKYRITLYVTITFPNIESPCRSLSPSQISNHPVGHLLVTEWARHPTVRSVLAEYSLLLFRYYRERH
jgi:hypothetical protein